MESCRCLWFKVDCSERWIQKVKRLAPGWNMWTSVWFFRTSQWHLKRIYLAGLAGKAALPTPDVCTASSWQALKWVGVRARAPWWAMPLRIATFLALAEALLRAWYQQRGENLKTLSPSCFSTPSPSLLLSPSPQVFQLQEPFAPGPLGSEAILHPSTATVPRGKGSWRSQYLLWLNCLLILSQ